MATAIKKPGRLFNKTLKLIWRYKFVYILLLPCALNFILFHYVPMGGLSIAFKNYIPGMPLDMAKWVGLKNFTDFFASHYAGEVIGNTVKLSFYLLIFGFPAPILLALALNEIRRNAFKRVVQTVSYIPYFISSVIIVGLLVLLLNPTDGVINNVVNLLTGSKIHFIESPKWFRSVYVSMTIWQGTGFGAIIYLSAISGVDAELYEAAIIDGAGRLARLWHITVMGILPTIMIMFILKIGTILNIGWMEVLLMQNKVNQPASEIIQTFVYKRGLINADYGFATAIGLLMSIASMILMIGANSFVKKMSDSEMSLF